MPAAMNSLNDDKAQINNLQCNKARGELHPQQANNMTMPGRGVGLTDTTYMYVVDKPDILMLAI